MAAERDYVATYIMVNKNNLTAKSDQNRTDIK